ncbi:MAG: hypothetical protein WCF09_04565, partial [Gallionella sp.]
MKLNIVSLLRASRLAALVVASVLVASCSGGGSLGTASNAGSVSGTLIPPPTATGNTLAVAVDAGPVPNVSQINVAYVSVTVCPPYT